MGLRGAISRLSGLVTVLTALAMLASPLASAASGSISGEIRDADTGEALGGVEVCAHPVAAETEFGPAEAVACTRSALDGSYRLQAVPEGEYKIRFSSAEEHYASSFYDGTATNTGAESVALVDGEAVTGIDAAISLAGRIEGTVTEAEKGAPVEGVEVCAYAAGFGRERVSCGASAADGSYAIEGLLAGEYKVEFRVGEITLDLAPQMYGHRYTWREGDSVMVRPGFTLRSVDAALDPGAQLSGEVKTATGSPAGGTRVCSFWEEADYKWSCTHTDALGRYRLWKLPPKTYRVGFSLEYDIRSEPQVPEVDGFLDEYSGRSPTLDDAARFPLAIGDRADHVDAVLLRSEELLVQPPLPSEAGPARVAR